MIFSRRTAVEFRRRLRSRFRMRALEWEHTVVAILLGVFFLGEPKIFASTAYSAPIFQWAGPTIWGWSIVGMGIVRLLALGINGYMARPTAFVRAFSAGLGVGVFGIITIGIIASGTFASALPAFIAITAFGTLSIAWAMVDVVIPDRHDDHPD